MRAVLSLGMSTLARDNLYIGVIGPSLESIPPPTQALLAAAGRVGQLCAAAGAVVVTGGLSGVMEAACRGAWEGNGKTIGLLPGDDRSAANDYLTAAIATGLGELRNGLVVRASDVLIAIGCSWGTLSEIAFAIRGDRIVVSLEGWNLPDHDRLVVVANAEEAVERALVLGRVQRRE